MTILRRAVIAAAMALLAGCGPPSDERLPAKGGTSAASAEPAPYFREVAAEVGLDFRHWNGRAGDYHMAEVTGSGVALIDYDGDGDLDVYMVQGGLLSAAADPAALLDPMPPAPLSDRLYRNDLQRGRPQTLAFTEVTAASGLADLATGYGMGVTVGDYDGDGHPDLYLTNLGPNQLLRNRGDGSFEDATETAGVAEERWSVPAVFFDYDGDDDLDLFVGNYLDYPAEGSVCRDASGAPDYCGPTNFRPLPDRLFRNLGDGSFADVTAASGLTHGFGPALGAIVADLDDDGLVDLYVTNDAAANNLWINRGDGEFVERGLQAGVALNGAGRAEASMGIDAGDYDGDGDLDLFMTHLISETNTLFRNLGGGFFEDSTVGSGLGPPSALHTAFGTGWLDLEGDGDLDLFVANGAVKKIEALTRARDPFPFHEPNQLFVNTGGRFTEASAAEGGAALALSEVSRGAAFGDLDEDGDTDIVISNNNGPARLLLNQRGATAPWLGVRPLDRGRIPPGTTASLVLSDERVLLRRARVDGSYASANDPRILFGLPPHASPTVVRVRWPDGTTEEWPAPPLATYTTLERGSGQVLLSGKDAP